MLYYYCLQPSALALSKCLLFVLSVIFDFLMADLKEQHICIKCKVYVYVEHNYV